MPLTKAQKKNPQKSRRVEKLSLCYFRGGTCPVDLDFDKAKPVVVIFGENGTGKSTIVDALDFVCNGRFGSIEDISGADPKQHLHSIGANRGDVETRIYAGGQEWRARLGTKTPELFGPDDRPTAYILRRGQILNLITGTPKERYDRLQHLISVARIESCESQLRLAEKGARSEVDEATTKKAQAEDTLHQIWVNEGSPGADFLSWARSEVAADEKLLRSSISEVSGLLDALKGAFASQANLNSSLETKRSVALELDDLDKQYQRERMDGDAALVNLLQEAERVLELESKRDECPVCEQAVELATLRARIGQRLSAIAKVVELQTSLDAIRKKVNGQDAVATTSRERLRSDVVKLSEMVAVQHLTFKNLPEAPEFSDDDRVAEFLRAVKAEQSSIETTLEDQQKTLNQLTAIRTNLESVDETGKQLVERQEKLNKLREILLIVEQRRKDFVIRTLERISDRAADLYSKVHPAEDIGNVRLILKPNVSGSLELMGDFEGTADVPPQAYYSDSHLDTLGVCVFLALAVEDPDGVVVLDDVFTSIDDAHLDRMILLLHEEAEKVAQLILTSHYRAWRDRYRYARGPAANIQLIELLPWSRATGIRHTRSNLAVDDLRVALKIQPLDRIGAATRAGIILESLLDDLALRYECKLPRRAEPNYTLGDLLSCIDSKLRKALSVSRSDGTKISIESLLAPLDQMTWIRNQVGCHFNLSGASVSDSEVRKFSEGTLKLAEALICSSCGELPRRQRSGSSWECSCGDTSLMPLQQPGGKAP